MKHLAAILFTVFFSYSTHAFYSNAWSRITLKLPINEHWTTDAEVQYRRQSGFAGHTPADYPLLFSYRHWIHYHVSRKVNISVSPFAYFRTNPIIRQPADRYAPTVDEYRFTAAIRGEKRLALNFAGEGRTALEYRLLQGQDVVRWRTRAALKYRMRNKWLFMPAFELFLNMSGADRNHTFDQWRVSADVAHTMVGNRLTAAVGYMYISRLPRTDTKTLGEHDIVIRFLYNLERGDE